MNAPVMIFTLNRIKHLKRCIESLTQSKEAVKTELYISVDFPPSEKYEKGYKEVKDYVSHLKGFKEINIFFQRNNLGPGLNSKFLRNEVTKKYDYFIISEDDNEFSSDFLEYMNWGLNEFKNDNKVYAICSTPDFPVVMDETYADYMRISAYNAYGTGHWVNKYNKCIEYLNKKDLNKIYRSKEFKRKLYECSPMLYRYVARDSLRKEYEMRNISDGLTNIDIWRNVYCIENGIDCIIPVHAKSRNWGMDGSGIHATVEQSADYIPSTEFNTNTRWPTKPICMTEKGHDMNMVSRAHKFEISKSEKRKCDIIFGVNALLGNEMTLSIYKMIKGYNSESNDINSQNIDFMRYV